MPRHEEQKTLAYTADELFGVVADVKDYPSFVPWCSAARIRSEDPQEIIADLEIGFGPFRECFTSQVTPGSAAASAGTRHRGRTAGAPDKHVEVHASGRGHSRGFRHRLPVQGHLLDHVANSMFHEAPTRMMGAFESRAHLIHVMMQPRSHRPS